MNSETDSSVVGPGIELFGIYLSSGMLWLLGAIGAIITLLLVIYLPQAIKDRRAAKRTFVEAFDTVMLNLRENPDCLTSHFAYSEHPKILAAIDRYRKHISRWKQKPFEKDVSEYKRIQDHVVNDGGVFAAVLSEDNEYGQRKRAAYRAAVEKLISYGT